MNYLKDYENQVIIMCNSINICTVGLTGTGVGVYTNACGDFSSGLIFDISGETKIVEAGKIWNLEKVIV